MKIHTRIIACLAVVTVLFSGTACGASSAQNSASSGRASATVDSDGYVYKAASSNAKSKDNNLVIAIEGSVSSMDPQNISDTNAITATRGVYENLVKFNDKQKIVGQLATSWETSPDALKYTFHLRKGVKFQDGTDFNAAAVKANYDRVVNAANGLSSRKTFIISNDDGTETPRVTNIAIPNDYTVVFTLANPWGPFLNRLTQFPMISPTAIKKYGNDIAKHAVGTGPFSFISWTQGDSVVLKRNNNYWGSKPGVDTVTIKEAPESGSRTAMLKTGEADVIYPTASDQIGSLKGSSDVNIMAADSNIVRFAMLNTTLPELRNIKVRKAMNYAIDKNAYVQLVYSGYGKPATSVIPSVIQGYKKESNYTFNLGKARKLMKEAGYEKGFKLTLWGDNSTSEIKAMTFLKQQLSQINIDVDVEPMEPATVSDKIYVSKDKASVNMWYTNWSASDYTADSSMRALLYSTYAPPTSANASYYDSKKFDLDMDKGMATSSSNEQSQYYGAAQDLVWNDAPWLFLGNDQILYSAKTYVSGVVVRPDGSIDFSTAALKR